MRDHNDLIGRLEGIATDNRDTLHPITLAALTEAAACIREMVEWREGMVLVPRVPTDAMLQGACKSHIPGQSMGTIRGFEHGECPSFERRRRIWADMVTAALPPAPGAANE